MNFFKGRVLEIKLANDRTSEKDKTQYWSFTLVGPKEEESKDQSTGFYDQKKICFGIIFSLLLKSPSSTTHHEQQPLSPSWLAFTHKAVHYILLFHLILTNDPVSVPQHQHHFIIEMSVGTG